MSSPLGWSYRTTQIPESGLSETRAATTAERAAVAQALEIPSCEALTSDFKISATGHGRYRLAGKVQAEVTQTCVVTLDPIEQRVEGAFDVEFWPVGSLPGVGEEEVEALSAAEFEPIEHGMIDAGRIVFETLSAGLDPYPRKPGTKFQPGVDEAGSTSASGPFAALQELKDRK